VADCLDLLLKQLPVAEAFGQFLVEESLKHLEVSLVEMGLEFVLGLLGHISHLCVFTSLRLGHISDSESDQRAEVEPNASFLDELIVHAEVESLRVYSDDELEQRVSRDDARLSQRRDIEELKMLVHADCNHRGTNLCHTVHVHAWSQRQLFDLVLRVCVSIVPREMQKVLHLVSLHDRCNNGAVTTSLELIFWIN